MTVTFYDTMARRKVAFEPRVPGEARMYHCGPTVYSSPHIGNFRSFLMADLLRRHLEARRYRVLQVMNITDVGHLTEDDLDRGEDKMMAAARREKLDPIRIARKYEKEFFEALDLLRFRRAHHYPRATEHIGEMIEMISTLVDKGYAYVVEGNVYFEEEKFEDFGALSHKKLEELIDGARVAVNEEKRSPRDFALWKTDPKHLMQWDSPWGRGFPGWHIECSAMSRRYLGDEIDIHTGGEDNVFPHHECEIAQSEASTGHRPFVRHWMHCRHLLVDGQKMSKSLGNFHTIASLREKGFTGLEIRYALLRVHYRMPLNFTIEGLLEARRALSRIRECRARLVRIRDGLEACGAEDPRSALDEFERGFGEAMDDDLNVSEALAVLFEAVTFLNRCRPDRAGASSALKFFETLEDWTGCLGEEPRVEAAAGVVWAGPPDDPSRERVEALAREREEARRAKDFAKADRLRDEIRELGFALVDGPGGPRIEPL